MLPSPIELTYFYEVARASNFTRAAKKLHVSQPSLSLAIKRLEESLDMPLFIRHKQGVELTRSGVELYSKVGELLDRWSDTKTNMQVAHQEVKGRVNIGINPATALLLSHLVTTLMVKYPALEIHLHHDLTPKIIENVSLGKLDIGITINPQMHPNLVIHKITDVKFAFCTAYTNSALLDLNAKEVILFCNPGWSQTNWLISELKKIYHHHIRLSTSDHTDVIATMTSNNAGIGILPTCYVRLMFADKLRHLENTPVLTNEMCLVFRPESKEVAAVQMMLGEIKDFLRLHLNSV